MRWLGLQPAPQTLVRYKWIFAKLEYRGLWEKTLGQSLSHHQKVVTLHAREIRQEQKDFTLPREESAVRPHLADIYIETYRNTIPQEHEHILPPGLPSPPDPYSPAAFHHSSHRRRPQWLLLQSQWPEERTAQASHA